MTTTQGKQSAQEIADSAKDYARTAEFSRLMKGGLSNKGSDVEETCRTGLASLRQDKTIHQVFLPFVDGNEK